MSTSDADNKTGWGSNEWLKLGFIIVSFSEALIMGLIPIKVKSFRESPKILGVANAFSGGVFIAIALMHIMPE
jgi:zinc transporter 1/2/3